MIRNEYSDRREVLFFKNHYNYLDGKVLDVGCGTGNAADFYKEYIGVTLNQKEMEVGRDRGREIYIMDAHDMNAFEKNKFDSFLMWDSLEHFISPLIVLRELQRVIKNGGKGLIFMPGQYWLDCHEHVHVLTINQMKHLLKQANWELIEVHPKLYPELTRPFDEMAVYYVRKNIDYKPTFRL